MRSSRVAAFAACAVLWLNVTVAEYLSSCKTPDGEAGKCVLVRECPFVQAVLRKQKLSTNDIRYVEAIRCGKLEMRSLVCCNAPNTTQTTVPVDAETIAVLVENRFNTREEKRQLLPTDCGDSFERRDDPDRDGVLKNNMWTALLQHREKEGEARFHCGGALINNRYVLTAARCIMGIRKTWKLESVRVGEWDLRAAPDCEERMNIIECAEPAQDIAIERITIHPNYTGTETPAVKHDIALVRLARDVQRSDSVAPICLPIDPAVRQDLNLEGDTMFVESGWGIAPEASGQDRRKNFYSVAVPRDACRNSYPHADIDEGHVCTRPEQTANTCRGDIGGALIHRKLNTAYLMGVASFRKQCANVGEPAVYTNVSPLVDWIVDNLEP